MKFGDVVSLALGSICGVIAMISALRGDAFLAALNSAAATLNLVNWIESL